MRETTKNVNREARWIRSWARLALIALPIAGAAVAGCGRSGAAAATANDAEPAPVAVKLVAAEMVKAPRVVTLSGSLIGSEEAQVGRRGGRQGDRHLRGARLAS